LSVLELLLDEDGEDIGLVEELAAPPAELDAAPVPPEVDDEASAPGAGEGVGVVVVDELDELGELGALEAGGGVTTLFSSFLQAVRPTATSAAMRSERVMIFPLGGADRH
jgi:hypothetical protein